MAENSNLGFRGRRARNPVSLLTVLWLLLALAAPGLQAAIQFDVFLGYDGIVPEASWFPVVCEIKNDGPTFNGIVELSGGYYTQGQSIRTAVELPTGTLKRIVIPVFCSSRMNSSWDLRLLDERGKMRAEQQGVRPRKQVSRGTPLIGALSRTASGAPVLRQVQSTDLQPMAARLLPSIFPDNPLVLEGLSCIYLSSERAYDLSQGQINALLAWLHAGGHLVIGVEQPSDVSALPWLRSLYPCEVRDLKTINRHPELNDWIRSTTLKSPAEESSVVTPAAQQDQFRRRYGIRGGPPVTPQPMVQPQEVNDFFSKLPLDLEFEAAPMQIAVGQVREGTVEISAEGAPLMVTTQRGRGRVTALLFSPEREPVRSWKNLDMFWAKLAEVPAALYVSKDLRQQGGWSSDGIFGAMIDTRQVHKLPVLWLLLLLIIYLVIIGPFDQWWLKRIGKPMLTWITFPCYVVVFSLVIYLIGYKLRAGESEWNELYVVDVLQKGEGAELRGRTYSSVYSPSNQRYTLEGQQKYATLRSEFAGLWGQNQSSERATVVQIGDTFKAEVFVPVWTSELYISDWWQSASVPVGASIKPNAQGWEVQIDNHTDRKLSNVQLVLDGRIRSLGELKPNESRTLSVLRDQGTPLASFVATYGSGFQNVVSSRQRALGASESGQLSDLPNSSVAASFLGQLYRGSYDNNFVSPPGLDMSSLVEHGNAVILAWAADYAPIRPMYHFTPKRSQKYTLWRVAVQAR